MKSFFKVNAFVLSVYLVLFVTGIFFVVSYSKADLHLIINQWHTGFFDIFFKYVTFLGNGWMVLALFLVFLLIKTRYAVIFLTGNFLITLLVQGTKHLIFPHALRPVAYFKGVHVLHLIPGVAMYSYNSFPSGHAATAFGIFVMLIFITKNRILKFLWLVIALLTAYSRIYLSQHFMVDILAGSLTGAIVMFLTVYYFNRYFRGFYNYPILYRLSHKNKV